MVATSFLRGHPMKYVNDQWVYSDNDEPTVNNPRACGHCNKPDRDDDHDACLGVLPGVSNACCGHGDWKGSYIQFNNGTVIRGFNVIEPKAE